MTINGSGAHFDGGATHLSTTTNPDEDTHVFVVQPDGSATLDYNIHVLEDGSICHGIEMGQSHLKWQIITTKLVTNPPVERIRVGFATFDKVPTSVIGPPTSVIHLEDLRGMVEAGEARIEDGLAQAIMFRVYLFDPRVSSYEGISQDVEVYDDAGVLLDSIQSELDADGFSKNPIIPYHTEGRYLKPDTKLWYRRHGYDVIDGEPAKAITEAQKARARSIVAKYRMQIEEDAMLDSNGNVAEAYRVTHTEREEANKAYSIGNDREYIWHEYKTFLNLEATWAAANNNPNQQVAYDQNVNEQDRTAISRTPGGDRMRFDNFANIPQGGWVHLVGCNRLTVGANTDAPGVGSRQNYAYVSCGAINDDHPVLDPDDQFQVGRRAAYRRIVAIHELAHNFRDGATPNADANGHTNAKTFTGEDGKPKHCYHYKEITTDFMTAKWGFNPTAVRDYEAAIAEREREFRIP